MTKSHIYRTSFFMQPLEFSANFGGYDFMLGFLFSLLLLEEIRDPSGVVARGSDCPG